MKFGFIAKHRGIWPVGWMCETLGVSRAGFYGWLTRGRSRRSRSDDELGARVRASFLASDRTYGARRVWHDLIADGLACGLHRIERLMRQQGLRARPRRRRLPPDLGERQANHGALAPWRAIAIRARNALPAYCKPARERFQGIGKELCSAHTVGSRPAAKASAPGPGPCLPLSRPPQGSPSLAPLPHRASAHAHTNRLR
jgi:hypothetical protein